MVKHEKRKERLECLRENYKIVLQKLWKKRDLETLLFLRVAYETGIRGNDILKMDMSCMKGRQILLAEKNIYEQRSVPGGISASKYIFFKKREIINNSSISAVELGYCRNAIDF